MKILNKINYFFLQHKVVAEITDHDFCYYKLERYEKSFQGEMKGVSFTVNGKEAKVLQIGHGAEGLRVQLQVGGTAMQQIQQTIVFKKENSTYRVSGNILDSYTVQDQVT